MLIMKKIIIVFYCFISLKINAQINPFNYGVVKKVACKKGAVVSAHPLASKVGLSILKQGGNAIDAAIATQLALAVVYPGAGNIGGGGFMVAHLKNGKSIAIDYREKAPGKAHRDMYLDGDGNAQLALSQDGHLAAGVPGTVAGLFASHKYGKLPFATLIQPAIDLAEKGYAITTAEASSLNNLKEEFLKLNLASVAFVKEKEWRAGDTLIQKDLANTLRRIKNNGQKGFYYGETARLIVQEMHKAGGLINYDDLEKYTAKERTPLQFNYKGNTIISMPLPSSGGIILQQVLGMIAPYSIGKLKFQTPQSVQLLVEAERRAFADRGEYLGDPDFVKVPVKTLVSKKYLTKKMETYTPDIAGNSTTTKAGVIKESEETTHISIIDNEGNAVAVTTTLNGGYGSRTVVTGAGFILNNEMDDFSVKPGVPNMYGAIGNEKNAIAPGKRMLSSMTPTIVLDATKNPFMVVGTPGGTTIPTSVIQTIINVIDFGMSAEDAVNKPKFHHQWLPDEVFVERNFDAATKAALEKMGYKVTTRGAIGRTELIMITPRGIFAVGDKRGDDDAEGY
jgi:gamma-glutamyltranspeptidase / glutathione hydrolase